MNLMTILMNQLKMRNPQAFSQFQNMKNGSGNPQELLKQATGKYTPEQMKNFVKFANDMGISNEQLKQFGINTN